MAKRFSKEELKKELDRSNKNSKSIKLLKRTISVLITVSAIAVLVATLWLPVLKIYGDSMSPTLAEGSYVVCVKDKAYKTGDIIAFYYNNKILVKRVISGPGEYFDMDNEGRIYVNGSKIDEPYIDEFAYGDTNITLPCQVPEDKFFVMGDHRATSLDSRNSAIGFVSDEQIVGKLVFCLWPMNRIKVVH